MIGALIGNIAGSKPAGSGKKALLQKGASLTGDSIMTLAIADAFLAWDGNLETLGKMATHYMQEAYRRNKRGLKKYQFATRFRAWLESEDPQPYDSYGSGGAMRVSPCGYVAKTLDEVKELSRIVTEVSHAHPEAIKGAEAVSVAIFMGVHGAPKDEIREYISQNYYPDNLPLKQLSQKKASKTAKDTVPLAMQAVWDADDFESAVRNAASTTGDTDTIATIAGSIAEAIFSVPRELQDQAYSYLDLEEILTVCDFESEYSHQQSGSLGETYQSYHEDKADVDNPQEKQDKIKEKAIKTVNLNYIMAHIIVDKVPQKTVKKTAKYISQYISQPFITYEGMAKLGDWIDKIKKELDKINRQWGKNSTDISFWERFELRVINKIIKLYGTFKPAKGEAATSINWTNRLRKCMHEFIHEEVGIHARANDGKNGEVSGDALVALVIAEPDYIFALGKATIEICEKLNSGQGDTEDLDWAMNQVRSTWSAILEDVYQLESEVEVDL